MSTSRIFLTFTSLACLSLTACGTPANIEFDKGQYWQRSSVSDAAYQRGPKAQQMLNKDIANCVVELRELERLGSLRNAIPANPHTDQVLSEDELSYMRYETPEREKHLFAEHGNYHDFESCMTWNGWERVKHVPFDVAHESRKAYLKAHIDYQYQSRVARDVPEPAQTQNDVGPYSDLND